MTAKLICLYDLTLVDLHGTCLAGSLYHFQDKKSSGPRSHHGPAEMGQDEQATRYLNHFFLRGDASKVALPKICPQPNLAQKVLSRLRVLLDSFRPPDYFA